jgi:GT2 family glycosyltransferase
MAVVSIVIATYNREPLLRECLASIFEQTDMNKTEIIVVDDASIDGGATVATVQREFPSVRLLAQAKNVGFGVANNLGVASAGAPYVMLLNNDAILLGDTCGSLVRFLEENPDVACVAPRIVLRSRQRQSRVFGNLPTLWRIAMQSLGLGLALPGKQILQGVDGRDSPRPVNGDVGWVSGVCMAMRRSDFIAVGGFDPIFFMYCEDVDLCWRLSERGRIVRLDDHPVLHYGGGVASSIEGQLRNSLLQQRNLLKIVSKRSGPGAVRVAAGLLSLGLALRIAAGLALIPRRGLKHNVVLRSSWLRMVDLIRPASMPVA